MQITSLNKTINLLIIGTFGLLNLFLLDKLFFNAQLYESIITSNQIAGNQSSGNQLIISQFWLGLVSVPFTIFLGILIDTICEIIKSFLNSFSISRKLPIAFYRFFGVYNDFSNYSYWKKEFRNQLIIKGYENEVNNGVATLIFFEFAKESSINWVISHFVSYLMARGFLIVSIVDLGFFVANGTFLNSVIALIVIFLLTSQLLGKNYYAYSILYRASVLRISDFFEKYSFARITEVPS